MEQKQLELRVLNDEIRQKEFEIAQFRVANQDMEKEIYVLKDELEPLEGYLNSEQHKGFAMDQEIDKFGRKGK